jgi:single-strand DNA-binding protein
MINKVTLIGNLGRDPETRNTNGGGTVCSLAIATSERQKDAQGNWSDHTEWHKVTCFGTTAENAAKFLTKGRQVYIEGKLRTSKWTDKDGKDRYTTEIIADVLKFIGGAPGQGEQRGGNERRAPSAQSRPAAVPDDGVPF